MLQFAQAEAGGGLPGFKVRGNPMICFEVRVNGKLVCTAGTGETGVLSAILTWVKHQSETCPEDMEEGDWCREDLDLGVADVAHQDDKSGHVSWLKQALKPGDNVAVRVVERDSCDPPAERKEFVACGGRNTFERPGEAAVAHCSRHVEPDGGWTDEVRLSKVMGLPAARDEAAADTDIQGSAAPSCSRLPAW